ncbi:hypothetical protein FI667_g9821, partial [Globisporangium splendens]
MDRKIILSFKQQDGDDDESARHAGARGAQPRAQQHGVAQAALLHGAHGRAATRHVLRAEEIHWASGFAAVLMVNIVIGVYIISAWSESDEKEVAPPVGRWSKPKDE